MIKEAPDPREFLLNFYTLLAATSFVFLATAGFAHGAEDPAGTGGAEPAAAFSEDCEFTLEADAVSCGAIRMRALFVGNWVTWTVNGVPADVPNGTAITHLIDEPGDYTFCATPNLTECELCETVTVTEACSESCGDISWTLMNDVVPNPGVAMIEANFDGDLDEGMLIFHMGETDIPYVSQDGFMGYQYNEGEYEVCVTFYGSDCSSTYCDTLVIGPPAVYGCTDPDAENFNPDATLDDGSCEYADCEISFEVAPSETEDDVLIVTPSPNIADAVTVLWVFGDGALSTDMYPFHQYEGDGPYELCIFVSFEMADGEDCTASYCMEVDASMLGSSSGFAIQVAAPGSMNTRESASDQGLTLWPNPARDEVSVRCFSTSGQAASLSVFDLSGRLVVQESRALNAGENTFTLRTDALVPGVYIAQLRQENEAVTGRLVIAK